jgi:hypothetical protein
VTEVTALYCLDTSALINPWNIFYAPDVAPGYWTGIEGLVADGRVVLSEELEKVDDGLRDWARVRIARWHPLTDAVQSVVTEIMTDHAKLVDNRTGRSRADPFVIATAKALGAKVVSMEGPGSERRPTIPWVCNRMAVPCLDVLAFVREAGLRLA